jgi:hypothetical protein
MKRHSSSSSPLNIALFILVALLAIGLYVFTRTPAHSTTPVGAVIPLSGSSSLGASSSTSLQAGTSNPQNAAKIAPQDLSSVTP